MKKLVSILCAAALVLSLAACGAESHSGGGDAKAAVYSLESATTFTFSDSGITAQDGSYTGYEIDGTTLTIDGAGAYVVTGTCADGSIQIKKGTTGVTLALNGLALTINAPVNDAINAQQLLNVESGTLTISAADDAIHSDLVLNIGGDGTDGPTIAITECYEGIEAAELNVLSGNIDILSSGDCLNAANSDLSGYAFSMNISGGIITACSSSGDGFDSNGDLTISGGTVAVWTANTADNQPLDADGAITVSGGTVLAAGGSAGMGMNLTAEQPCVTFGSTGGMGGGRPGDMDGGSASIAKDAAVTITGSDGSAVYSGTALCNANFVFFSSPEPTADGSYTLTAGDTSLTATAQTGSISSGGMGGPGNGGQRPGDRDGGQQAPDFSGGGQPPERPGSQQSGTAQNS